MTGRLIRRLLPSCLILALAACGGGGASPGAPSGAISPSPSPSPDPGPAVLRSASLRGANGHSTSGTARILRSGGSFTLELGPDFRIDSGNNDVYLTSDPGTIRGSDLNLGSMQSLTGRQAYAMPDDGGRYGYVMLWCRPFRVPIGLGELR